jgi:hypothetical protein
MNPWTNTIASLAAGAVAALSIAIWNDEATQAPLATETAAAKPDAIAFFFDAFQRHPERRDEAIARLTERALAADALPKEVLYAGLAHLWAAAEGAGTRAATHEHAVLAEHWLAQAEAGDPADTRIAGWHESAAWSVASIEGDDAGQAAAIARLEVLAVADPCFNSITLGTIAFTLPRDHPSFQRALTAMNAAFECGQTKGGQDRPRWPHSVAGFLVALSDYRLKSGDSAGAEAALVIADARDSTARWPHRALLDERFKSLKERSLAYANADPTDDPPFALRRAGAMCTVCHAASADAVRPTR